VYSIVSDFSGLTEGQVFAITLSFTSLSSASHFREPSGLETSRAKSQLGSLWVNGTEYMS
jgi:hypothetical protein